jgi:hypothetical protein
MLAAKRSTMTGFHVRVFDGLVAAGIIAGGLFAWRSIILRLGNIEHLLARLVREANTRNPQIDLLDMVPTEDGLKTRAEVEEELRRDD